MRKPYIRQPLDSPLKAFDNAQFEWMPMLTVRVGRRLEPQRIRLEALLDTGSPFCLFRADVGRSLGIDLDKGIPVPIGGPSEGPGEGPRTVAYFHNVQLSVEDLWTVEVRAGFVEHLAFGCILGRRGFFENFKAVFDHSTVPPCVEVYRI